MEECYHVMSRPWGTKEPYRLAVIKSLFGIKIVFSPHLDHPRYPWYPYSSHVIGWNDSCPAIDLHMRPISEAKYQILSLNHVKGSLFIMNSVVLMAQLKWGQRKWFSPITSIYPIQLKIGPRVSSKSLVENGIWRLTRISPDISRSSYNKAAMLRNSLYVQVTVSPLTVYGF